MIVRCILDIDAEFSDFGIGGPVVDQIEVRVVGEKSLSEEGMGFGDGG